MVNCVIAETPEENYITFRERQRPVPGITTGRSGAAPKTS